MATSYANAGGTGNRTGSITTSKSSITISGTLANIVDGNTASTAFFFGNVATAGHYVRWEFASPKIIDEAKWYQSTTGAQGTWKWQGSNDGSSWTDIGSSFALGGATTQTITALAGNTTAYKYYQILGVSGSTSSGPNVREIEFKIDDFTLSVTFNDGATTKVGLSFLVDPDVVDFTTPGADTFTIPAYDILIIELHGAGAAGAAWVDGVPIAADLGADGGNSTLTIPTPAFSLVAGGGDKATFATGGSESFPKTYTPGGKGGIATGGHENTNGQNGEDGRYRVNGGGSLFGSKGGDAPLGGAGGPRGAGVGVGYGGYYAIGQDGTAPGGGGGSAGIGGQAGPPISGDYTYQRALGAGGAGARSYLRFDYSEVGAPEPGTIISFNIGAGGTGPTGDGSPTLDGGDGANGRARFRVELYPTPPAPDGGQGTCSIDTSGPLRVGSILTAVYNNDDPDGGETDFAWQWSADGVAVAGATGETYELQLDDVGKDITVEITYTDALGYTETIDGDDEVGPVLPEARPLDDLLDGLFKAYGMRKLVGSYDGPLFRLLSGTTSNGSWGWQHSAGTANSGNYIRFDFGTARVITEAMMKQNTYTVTVGQGVFQWQGSNDASSWTNIGSAFALNVSTSSAPYPQTELNGNSTAYRYYQLLGVSGNWANNLVWEVEFKIDDNGQTSRCDVGVQSYRNPGGEGPRNSMITVSTSFATANIDRIVNGKYPDAELSFWPHDVTGEVDMSEIAAWQTAISPISSVSRFSVIYDQSGNGRHLINTTVATVGSFPDAWNSSFVKYTVPNGRWAPKSNGNQRFTHNAINSPQNSLYFMEFLKRDNDNPIFSWRYAHGSPKGFQHAISTANDWLDNQLVFHGNGINSGNPRAVTTATFPTSDTDVVCYEGAQNASRHAIGVNGSFQALSVNNVGYHNEAGTTTFSWPYPESNTNRDVRACEFVMWDIDVGILYGTELALYRLDGMLTWMDSLPAPALYVVFEDDSELDATFMVAISGPTLTVAFYDDSYMSAFVDGVEFSFSITFDDGAELVPTFEYVVYPPNIQTYVVTLGW